MPKLSRLAVWLLLVPIILIVLGVLTLVLPVPSWRTGRTPIPPLDLTLDGGVIAVRDRIWIDTDAACGATARTDPDDCLAIALLVKARAGHIVGISTVFGNASLDVVQSTTRELVRLLAAEKVIAPVIYAGAATANRISGATLASAALANALAEGPLTIVSLGPLSNIAATLQDRPDLQKNVARLVAVMGHRPGHVFHPTEGESGAILFGHGPVFRDFNFAMDPEAARRVLAMRLPVTLIPYDAARHIGITAADLDALSAGSPAAAWMAARARGWLQYWTDDIGQEGFYPFDLVAAAYVLRPSMFRCAPARAWIESDDTVWASWFYSTKALLVGPMDTPQGSEVLYCPTASEALKEISLTHLTAP